MMGVRYKFGTKKENIYRFLEILDCMQLDEKKRMFPSERKLLTKFLLLPDKYERYRFSTAGKRVIIDALEEKTGKRIRFQHINNKIYSLIDKGILWRDADSQIYLKKYLKRGLTEFLGALKEGKSYELKFRFEPVS